jgi:hypothetical protein
VSGALDVSTQKRLGVTNVALGERFENGNVLAASTFDARLAQFVDIGVLGKSPEIVLQATSVFSDSILAEPDGSRPENRHNGVFRTLEMRGML